MKKNIKYQLVVVENGQYGFVYKCNVRRILDHPYKTYDEALAAATRRYRMLQHSPDENDRLEGTPEDFTVTVKKTEWADFSDHYYIEEVKI